MKKLITIILVLATSVAFGQTTYQLNYDSIRVGKTAGNGATSLYGKTYLKNATEGAPSDSVLTVRNGRVYKIAGSAISSVGFLTYVFSRDASDIAGYEQMPALTSYTIGAADTATVAATTTPAIIQEFATNTGFPNTTLIPAGVFNVTYQTQKNSGSQSYYTYAVIYKRNLSGTETAIATTNNSSSVSANTVQSVSVSAVSQTDISVLTTDRIVVKVFAVMVSGTANISIYYDDATDSRLAFPSALADATNFVPYNGAVKDLVSAFSITGDSIKRVGGTSSQFLKGDGSVTSLGTSAISLGGTANGLSYSNGNYRLHKVTSTTGGVFTTGTDTIAGLKRFTSGIIISGGGLSTTAGLTATGTGVATSLQSTNNTLTTEFRTSTSVGFIGTDNNGLIFAPSSGTKSFELLSGGSVQIPSLNASGNIIVGADNNGTLGKIAIGSGLSLSSGTLTATGGSSGSVTTAGGTSGKIAKFTSASNIENSIMTEATNNITFGGTDGTEVITLQGGGNDRMGMNYSSSLMQVYSKNALPLRLGVNLGTTGINVTSGGNTSINSDGVAFTVSSNNSNTYKFQLRDVTTTRGFIGANSTNAFMVGNNDATSNLLTINNSSGAVTATSFVGALTGNASTATALQTARTISGVSFDGTANITLNNNAITNGAGYITSSALTPYAPLDSPTFTGTPTLPTGTIAVTQTQGDNSTKLATTAYVDAAKSAAVTTGTLTYSGDGVSTVFTTDNLSSTGMVLTATSAAAAAPYYITSDNNGCGGVCNRLIVTFLTAPASGTNNITFNYLYK